MRRPRFKYHVLRIPGTHGTWPKRMNWYASKSGAYVAITRPTVQRTWSVKWWA